MMFHALITEDNEVFNEFYQNMTFFRGSAWVQDLLIRKKRCKDGVVVTFGYSSPLGTIPLLLGCFFGVVLYSFGFLNIYTSLGPLFFFTAYYLSSAWFVYLLFKMGLYKKGYRHKVRKLSHEQAIRRILKR